MAGDIWGAIGVVGGAIYATYSTITSLSIKTAIANLQIKFLERMGEINTQVAMQSTEIANLERRIDRLEDGSSKCLFVAPPNGERRT